MGLQPHGWATAGTWHAGQVFMMMAALRLHSAVLRGSVVGVLAGVLVLVLIWAGGPFGALLLASFPVLLLRFTGLDR